jgi:hypothetical protein
VFPERGYEQTKTSDEERDLKYVKFSFSFSQSLFFVNWRLAEDLENFLSTV